MTYFWTIQEHVPDGLGFRLFGIAHLLWLGGIVLAVLAIALTCRRWKPETVHRLLCGLTWAALLLEICKDGVLLYTGQFRPNYLPLDLCGLSIFVEFAAVRNPVRCCWNRSTAFHCRERVWHCCFPTGSRCPCGTFSACTAPAPRAAGAGAGGAAGSRDTSPQLEAAAILFHLRGGGVCAGFAGEPPLRHQLFLSGTPVLRFAAGLV